MKSLNYIFLMILFILIVNQGKIQAQGASISVVTPVCNHDGVLAGEGFNTGSPDYEFNWYTNEGLITHIVTDAFDTLTNFSGGIVSLYVLPLDGSSGSFGSLQVPFPFQIVSTIDPDTCPLQTGAISLAVSGGVMPYTYSWTYNGTAFPGNTNVLNNLSGGYYDCVITDIAGCQMNLHDRDSLATGSLVPSINNITFSISSTPANCTNGTATVTPSGGTAPYTYFWSNGQTTATATGLTGGNQYHVTITDANLCFKNASIYVQSQTTINVNTSITNAHCTMNDGAVIAIPTGGTGPYSFLWNTFATTSSISNIPAGTYSVTVSDMQGCIRMVYATVSALTPVNVSYNTTPSLCTGATGSINAVVTGGTPPYSYQWFSNPVQTTPNASGLSPGSYNFLITDALGCLRSGTAIIPQNTTLDLAISTTSNVCALNNGTATMNVSGGVMPYNYLWSNGAATASISAMPSTFIYGTVTDAAGCHITRCELIGHVTNLHFILNPINASCVYTADGSISVNITAGTPPFTYAWSNGSTSATISNLLPGFYSLLITDAMGCTFHQNCQVGYNSVTPCTGIVQGSVFIDLNGNCSHEPNEPVMQNIPVKCLTTGDIVYTDNSGIYQLIVPVGPVTIQQLHEPYRYQVCPAGNPFAVTMPAAGLVLTQDIADTVEWVNDLSVDMYNWSSPPVVGFTYVRRIVEFNKGINALATSSLYDYDAQAPFSVSNPGPSSLMIAQHTATFNNPIALPLTNRIINVTHNIPASVPINTTLYFTDTIFPVTGDTTWWDNMIFRQVNTVGSYDPNYKEVFPPGTGSQGYISPSDSILEYVIHFQNIGNYYAENIVIEDQLSSNLDWNSLRIRYATHNVTTQISASGLLKFSFNNIYLPSIVQDTLLSNGFVAYTIHLKPGLTDGTQITNDANIFFDFNGPVKTNTTLNTISITGLPHLYSNSNFQVYPNPAIDAIEFSVSGMENQFADVELYNVYGQFVKIIFKGVLPSSGSPIHCDLSQLSQGIYFVKLNMANGSKIARIVKM